MTILGQYVTTVSSAQTSALVRCGDRLFWSHSGGLYVGNVGGGGEQRLRREGYEISSVVLDSWAKRIYYSVPSLQVVRRVTTGGELELTLDTERGLAQLAISEEAGLLCGLERDSAVTCSDLRGEDSREVHRLETWGERKIINIALDNQTLYMIIQTGEGYKLFSKEVFGDSEIKQLRSLGSPFIHGNLFYMDRKVIYLEKRRVNIIELDGSGSSSLDLKSYVDGFYIHSEEETDLQCPPNSTEHGQPGTCVVPGQVAAESVGFVTSDRSVSLVWEGVEASLSPGYNVTYTVLIKMTGQEELMFRVTQPPLTGLTLPAHTACEVTITPWSVHALAPPTVTQLVTPQDLPSPPTRLSVYWTASSQDTEFTIRWGPPEQPNGRILHYEVSCVRDSVDHCQGATSESTNVTLSLPIGVYNISVSSVNQEGTSNFTEPHVAGSVRNHPQPRLITVVNYPPEIQSLDVFSKDVKSYQSASLPKYIEYLSWMDSYLIVTSEGRIKIQNRESNVAKDFMEISDSKVIDVTIDHYGHFLFVLADLNLIRVDLDSPSEPQVIMNLAHAVSQIGYHQMSGKIIILENHHLFKSHISPVGKATIPKPLSDGVTRRKRSTSCSCPNNIEIDSFAIVPNQDQMQKEARLVIRDLRSGLIYLTDETMCNCIRVAETELIEDNYLLKSDLTNIYVMSKTSKSIHIIDLISRQTEILRLNSSYSPLFSVECSTCDVPTDLSCLRLQTSHSRLGLVTTSSTSVLVSLPTPRPLAECSSPVPLPSTKYVIHYTSNFSSSDWSELTVVNHGNQKDKTLTLTKLRPNTVYHAKVDMSNVYMAEEDRVVGDTMEFRTQEGSPGSVRQLEARVMSPHTLELSWLAPEEKHSDELRYEVHWSSEGYEGGNKINKQLVVSEPGVSLSDLLPGHEYSLWVVARAGASGLFSNNSVSQVVRVKMFEFPDKLMVTLGARDMNVTWRAPGDNSVAQVYLEYYASHLNRETQDNMTRLETRNLTRGGQEVQYSISDLTPGLCYVLTLKLR